MRISQVPTPALCVDLDVVRAQPRADARLLPGPAVRRSAPTSRRTRRPAIARLQQAAGAASGSAARPSRRPRSSRADGFDDLLIANEVCDPTKIDRLVALSKQTTLTVAVDSRRAADILAGTDLRVLIDVNVGLPRCGVPPEDAVELARVATRNGLHVVGVMGYEGHATAIEDVDKRARRRAEVDGHPPRRRRRALRAESYDISIVSAGSTLTYDVTGTIDGITEVQVGSYALMDTEFSKSSPFEEALRCLATVVSVNDNIAVLDCRTEDADDRPRQPEAAGRRPGRRPVPVGRAHDAHHAGRMDRAAGRPRVAASVTRRSDGEPARPAVRVPRRRGRRGLARRRAGLRARMSFSGELAFANGLADIADEISMRYLRNADTEVRSKTDGTPVTQADEEIERAAAQGDRGRVPRPRRARRGGRRERAARPDARWILDPIDGTKNFSWGIPVWGDADRARGGRRDRLRRRERPGARRAVQRGPRARRDAQRRDDPRLGRRRPRATRGSAFTSVNAFVEQGRLDAVHAVRRRSAAQPRDRRLLRPHARRVGVARRDGRAAAVAPGTSAP